MVWYSHRLNFPQLVVIHTVKGFNIVKQKQLYFWKPLFPMTQWMLAVYQSSFLLLSSVPGCECITACLVIRILKGILVVSQDSSKGLLISTFGSAYYLFSLLSSFQVECVSERGAVFQKCS